MNTPRPSADRLSETGTSLSKGAKLVAAIALGTAALSGCADKPQPTDAGTATIASTSSETSTPAVPKQPSKVKSGEESNISDSEDFDDWRKRGNRESKTLKSHNRGNIVDVGAFVENDKIRNFRVKNGREYLANIIKGTKGACDTVCIDLTAGENKKAATYEAINCTTPTTDFGTLMEDYSFKADGVENREFVSLDGEDYPFPDTTKHVLAQVQPGKNCADLSRGRTNTGTGTVRVNVDQGGPYATKEDVNALGNRVGQVEENLGNLTTIVETHSTLIQNLNLCTNNPQAPVCVQARQAVRDNVTNEAKARAEKK